MNENVMQSSAFSAEIASEIAEVNTIVESMADNSKLVDSSAGELNQLATEREQLLGGFTTNDDDTV